VFLPAISVHANMYRGVTQLPYVLTVIPATNLTPLSATAGALTGDHQGNLAHGIRAVI